MATAGWQSLVQERWQGGCVRSCLGVQHRPPASQELTQHRASTVLPALRLGSSRVGAGRGAAKPARPQARTPAPPLLQAGLGRLAQRRAARRGEGSPSSAWPRRAHVPAAAKHCSNTTPQLLWDTRTHVCTLEHAPCTHEHTCMHPHLLSQRNTHLTCHPPVGSSAGTLHPISVGPRASLGQTTGVPWWGCGGGPTCAQPWARAHPAARQPMPGHWQHSPTSPLDLDTPYQSRALGVGARLWLGLCTAEGMREGGGAGELQGGRDENAREQHLCNTRHLHPWDTTHKLQPRPRCTTVTFASPKYAGRDGGGSVSSLHHGNWLHRNNIYILMIFKIHR